MTALARSKATTSGGPGDLGSPLAWPDADLEACGGEISLIRRAKPQQLVVHTDTGDNTLLAQDGRFAYGTIGEMLRDKDADEDCAGAEGGGALDVGA